MSAERRLKKLRGSGGYVMASVTDDQQKKGNLGGPDLFLAPVGRLEPDIISKYHCNTCDKDYDGSPKIEYENPNELVADNLILLEKGQYICTNCGSILAEYRNFSKPNQDVDVGLARPQSLASQIVSESSSTNYPSMQPDYSKQVSISQGVTNFNSITGLPVYDSDARRIGAVKQIGIQKEQAGIVLVVTKNDGADMVVKWENIKKIGDIVLLGDQASGSDSKCSECSFENKPDSKFCESCGKKLK